MSPGPVLLLLAVGAACGPAAAFVSRQTSQQVNDVLTEKLFAVSRLLTSIESHVSRLDEWDGTVGGLQSRLAALEAGQQRAAGQLADALQRLETLSDSAAAARSELAGLAAAQEGTAGALAALRDGLAQSVAAVSESVSGLATSQAAEHNQTRGACSAAGGAALTAPLAELRTAVGRVTELAQRTEAALADGLQRVDGRLAETGEQLAQLGGQLREERQARLSVTTPRPTVDPHQAFLNSLYRSLSKRTKADRYPAPTPSP
ncbi:hypothetical protein FJT64_023470 [Amphibalanus amphitrite]|uniref:Uncharacterized protein n=1 Tax=Amphibalanus amphitrite TaxID=1232801 RepID=A0A6A4WFL4_AMPAM|nr:methyl-accepting chemotaxis protein CtpL-like [Amphibalanus amphitrite]XP_043209763.1 methyl-accepting chemotaxis protein CtpL-like [Amphibalanus amphitrite]KAF0304793.1 hypothetical protein FJT64_023470 [Amphibalanus amphitrite]